MRTRTIIAAILLAGSVAGCGSSHTSAPPATPVVASKTYTDPNFGFSFSHPGDWKAPKQGTKNSQAGANNYFVRLSLPQEAAGMEVEVSGSVTQFPNFKDGHQAKDPNGPDIFTYYHARVSGLPALRVLRSYKNQVDEIATFVNVGHQEYAIRTVIGKPPFPSWVKSGYDLIIRTFKLPSGS